MPIAPRLLECGVDGFQGFQEKVGTPVDLESLSELRTRRGRKPVLIGSVSTTATLPFGAPDDVRREVARCVALARRRGGGLLLNASSSVGPEVPKENLYALFGRTAEVRDRGGARKAERGMMQAGTSKGGVESRI